MRLEHQTHVNCPPRPLYRLISDIERHATLLPGYTESRIVSRAQDHCVVQRQAVINGKYRRWQSEVRFDDPRALHFRQLEGPLRDMRVDWLVEPDENGGSRLRIIHELPPLAWWKSWWMTRWVAGPAIDVTARAVLAALKAAAERMDA